MITIKDWVKTQATLSDKHGIEQWYAVFVSIGRMQALRLADCSERLQKCVIIASASKLSTKNISFMK